MNALILAALIGAAPPAAASADWVLLRPGPDGAATYYDRASVERGESGFVRVRMRAVPARSSTTGAREYLSLEEVNCERRLSTTINVVAEMIDGRSIELPASGEPDSFEPNSPLAALHSIVCPAADSA